MIGNQVVSTMVDFDTCNHMARFILRDDGNEYPGSHHIGLGCDEVFMNFSSVFWLRPLQCCAQAESPFIAHDLSV
jgi:hypothetical protein